MKILIVDDSRAMRMIVTRALHRAGYEDAVITEAPDGAAALERIEADTPDLILSDWNMPVLDGLGLLEEVRRRNLRIPFGFVTSEADPAMRSRATAAGADFFIVKPFNPAQLRDAIEDARRG